MNTILRFRINRPKVIHETFDDEVVAINLDSGDYYSFSKVGADIWSFIERRASVGEIVEGITHRYECSHGDIENSVNRFIAELQQEGLILPDNKQETENIKGSDVRIETGSGTERFNFEEPILHKYSDMQELILLDPIHDVDETGWPSGKQDLSKKA